MGIFSKEETLFEQNDILLGKLNLQSQTGTGYDNIMLFPFDVKKNRKLRVHVVSEKPIDVALSTQDGGMLGEVGSVTEVTLGPYDTKNYADACVFLGIIPGEKSLVSVKAWVDNK